MNEKRNFISRIRQAFKSGIALSENKPENLPPHLIYDGMPQTQIEEESKSEDQWSTHEAYLYLYMYWHI